ncbi:hypothetical protein K2X40_04645 [Candidatus Babeliales bacterium]|nr:hypothetical protein [Candidatus Babeliales bacterium]MBY0353784.1 hypothetical protein [Candidatus Babeliales bacterium]
MKTIKISFLIILCLTTLAQAKEQTGKHIKEAPYIQRQEFNKLRGVAIAQNDLSTQITFDFSQPIYFKQKLNQTNRELKLWFPGMNLKNFNIQQVLDKINQLKTAGLIEKIEINEKNKSIPNVMLTLTFSKYRTNTTTNKSEQEPAQVQNKLLIKWSQTEEPNQLILDIFSVESLEKIKQKNSVLLRASRTNHAIERSMPSCQAWRPTHHA